MARPARPGPWPPAPSQPQPLSWAKRTAFKNAPISNSGQISTPNATPSTPDLESGPTTASANAALPPPPANPVASAGANQNASANRVNGGANGTSTSNTSKERKPSPRQRERDSSAPLPRLRERETEEEHDELPQRHPHAVKYQLRDTPGLC